MPLAIGLMELFVLFAIIFPVSIIVAVWVLGHLFKTGRITRRKAGLGLMILGFLLLLPAFWVSIILLPVGAWLYFVSRERKGRGSEVSSP